MKPPKNKTLIVDLRALKKLAQQLMMNLHFPITIQLFGELGTGKTQFTKYCAEALGIKELVNSPSFIKINRYAFDTNRYLSHLDGFQIKQEDTNSLIDYLNDDLVIIEWPQTFIKMLDSHKFFKIYFEPHNQHERKISFDASPELLPKIANIFYAQS